MIIDLTEDMAKFEVGKGLCFQKGIKDVINGWISASILKPR
jgi:hypothetical protein